ncbi:MAG: pseudouridine synthase [Cryomorphaceae bacterium]|nr:MAG: pseudouridine synthase [Cryomorphaceae bacterium]
MNNSFLYYKFYKPFGYLSQFTDEDGNPGLGRILNLPGDVYPVGRLDKDSEGLLLLTNDNALKSKLLNPDEGHSRTYWVQVEGEITKEAIEQLNQPMLLRLKGKEYRTRKAKATIVSAPSLPDRDPPIRFRKIVPTSWMEITLTEGKNRQVRRMTAKTGFPTLRLIRGAFGDIRLNSLQPGEIVPLSNNDFHLLKT